MNQLFPIPVKPMRYISLAMVFIALAWLIAPESQALYQNPEAKFFNPAQPPAAQVVVLKTKTKNFSIRDYYSESGNSVFIYRSNLLLSLSQLITYRVPAERNPFYVHVTINAP